MSGLKAFSQLPNKSIYTPTNNEDVAMEERKGLLSGGDNGDYDEDVKTERNSRQGWSRKKIAGVSLALIMMLLTGTFARRLLLGPPQVKNSWLFSGDELRSNGTHDFKRTVLIVSIDGLRYVRLLQTFAVANLIMYLTGLII